MSEATNEEQHRQIRAYEATVHNMQLRLDEAIAERDALRRDIEAVGAGGVQALGAATAGTIPIPRETLASWSQCCAQHLSLRVEMEIDEILSQSNSINPKAAPQQETREPLDAANLAQRSKVGAIHTDQNDNVVLRCAEYRNQMTGRFERGWREAEQYYGITAPPQEVKSPPECETEADKNKAPVGVVESAVRGAGGFHVRLAAGAQMPPVGAKLYLAALRTPQQEVQEPFGYVSQHTSGMWAFSPTLAGVYQDTAKSITAVYKKVPAPSIGADGGAANHTASAELERLRERIGRIGLDVDRAMGGHVNEQSPLGVKRLAAIAALAAQKGGA